MNQENQQEMTELRARLAEAEETLRAIRSGEVDALVVSGVDGYQVYTLKGAEQPYRIFIEEMREGAATITSEGTVLYCNHRFAEMVRSPLESIIGSSIYDYVPPQDHPQLASLMQAGGTGSSKKELNLASQGGGYVPVYLSVNQLNMDGVEAFCVVATDLTEQKQNEENLAAERRKADEERLRANKLESLGILAGGLAHDFNNFLATILGNVSLVKRSVTPDSEVHDRLTQAEKACLQARSLTQQLLTFARGGAPVKKSASIAELLKETATFVLRGSNVRCKYSIPDDLWVVEVDEGQINRVISNLIINAEQAMPEGGVVKVEAENLVIKRDSELGPLIEPGKYIRISIIDRGIGIPREHLSKVFDPYFTTKAEGSGLGLATSYSIIKNHNGYLAVESEPKGGSTFHVYLPASDQINTRSARRDMGHQADVVTRNIRALVMDDQDAIREMLGFLLGDMGFEVGYARNGTEAVQMYRQATEAGEPYDVVLMDLTIPGGMGGREAIAELKAFDPHIKAIVLSGYSNSEVMAESEKYGFSGVIPKPFEVDTLVEILNSMLPGTAT